MTLTVASWSVREEKTVAPLLLEISPSVVSLVSNSEREKVEVATLGLSGG